MRTVESAQWAASGLFDVTNKTKPIVINCELDEDEILYPNVTFCTVLKNVNKKLFEAMEKVPGIEEDRAKLAKALNYTAEKKLDYQELRDELSARLAHGKCQCSCGCRCESDATNVDQSVQVIKQLAAPLRSRLNW